MSFQTDLVAKLNALVDDGEIQELNSTKDFIPLAGQVIPPVINKRERPRHRAMLELTAKGYDNKEIAQILGVTQVNVNNVLRQPALQTTLIKTIQRVHNEDEEVVEVIKRNVVKSVELYEEVISDPKLPLQMRMEAAERFLNRRYGKPNQPINRDTGVDLDSMSIAEVAAQLPQTQTTGTSK